MLVSQNVPNLINGVSQQADALRYPSQCVEQSNFYPTILRGLSKRPPTQHVRTISNSDLYGGNYAVHKIERSPTERFNMFVSSASLRITDLNGLDYQVRDVNGNPVTTGSLAYLTTASPKTSIRSLTVADYTFLLNTEQVVTASALVPANNRDPEALVFVKQVRDGADYIIRIYDDPASSTVSHTIQTLAIKATSTSTYTGTQCADQGGVADALNASFGASSANALYDHFIDGSGLLYIKRKSGANFRIESECSITEGMFAFKDAVQSFALLPKAGWSGFRIKVNGDPEDAGDDYYLKYVPHAADAQAFCEGSWEETQALSLSDDRLDAATLPHALTFHGSYFVFAPIEWNKRTCGDKDTNPAPSCVGQIISDIFFRKNRLGLLSGENMILSCAGDFFNLWRTTVIQLLDGDVIDVGASHTKIALLKNAVAASEKLVLFSEQTQFVMDEGSLLTPRSVEIKPASEIENITTVRPVAVGNSIFFPFERAGYAGFNEYAVSTDTTLFEGYDITEHVPNYIVGAVQSFVASDLLNVLAVKADAEDTLYLYTFFKRGQQRIQSSWSKLYFRGAIRGYYFIGSRLYLIILRDGVLYLEYLDLLPGLSDLDTGNKVFVTHLDRRVTEASVTRSYNVLTDETKFTLPYAAPNGSLRIVVRSGAFRGTNVSILRTSGADAWVSGDRSASLLWFGEVYASLCVLTRPTLREKTTDGSFVINVGRFQVRYGTITVDQTLDFSVQVTPLGRPSFLYNFASRLLGTLTSITGSAPVPLSVPFRFPVFSKNDQVTITITNESYLPCNLISLDWEALYAARAQRV